MYFPFASTVVVTGKFKSIFILVSQPLWDFVVEALPFHHLRVLLVARVVLVVLVAQVVVIYFLVYVFLHLVAPVMAQIVRAVPLVQSILLQQGQRHLYQHSRQGLDQEL